MKIGKIFLITLIGMFVSFNVFANDFKVVCGADTEELNQNIVLSVPTETGKGITNRAVQNVSSPAMDASGSRICATVTYREFIQENFRLIESDIYNKLIKKDKENK